MHEVAAWTIWGCSLGHIRLQVRDKVRDLLKLGEMKWRYRVVEEEQSPRDEAIKVLGVRVGVGVGASPCSLALLAADSLPNTKVLAPWFLSYSLN